MKYSWDDSAVSFIDIFREVFKVELFSSDLSIELENVFSLIFEVGGGIKAFRDEETVAGFGSRDVSLRDSDELLLDVTYQLKGSLDFFLGVVGLDSCAHNGNIVVLFTDAMN